MRRIFLKTQNFVCFRPISAWKKIEKLEKLSQNFFLQFLKKFYLGDFHLSHFVGCPKISSISVTHCSQNIENAIP